MDLDQIPQTTVIAFGHRARHGKDFAAGVVARHFPEAQRFGFADALKAVCRVQYGMSTKDARLLQRIGLLFREGDPDVWLKALYWTIEERQPEIALITDMRFPNEFNLVRHMGGYTVKVERRDASGRLFVPTDRDPNHESEIALASETRWDATITNPEGQIDVFRSGVLSTVGALLENHRRRGTRGHQHGETKTAA